MFYDHIIQQIFVSNTVFQLNMPYEKVARNRHNYTRILVVYIKSIGIPRLLGCTCLTFKIILLQLIV